MNRVIALAGNPNAGKTTLFNLLTGANQRVGNFPGITVSYKEGKLKDDKDVTITDLPGIYSLSPYTQEEVVSRNYILDNHPDAIINIIDGSNLERNLYLTTQVLELGVPVVVAVNMMDIVRKNGDKLDVAELSRQLGTPVVEISALKNEGIPELVKAITAPDLKKPTKGCTFPKEVESALTEFENKYLTSVDENQRRWYAVKLFERDEKAEAKLSLSDAQKSEIDATVKKIEDSVDDDAESIITTGRYDQVEKITSACYVRKNKGQLTTSDKIDRVVTSRVWGLPIFIVIMFLVYYLSISTVGAWGTDWFNDHLFGDGWYAGNFSGSDFEAYSEDNDAFTAAQDAISAYEEAAEDAGLDPTSDDFVEQAAAQDLTTSYDSLDEDSGENTVITVYATDDAIEADPDADENAISYQASQDTIAELTSEGKTNEDGDEIDPSYYGPYVPGVPSAVSDGLEAIGAPEWLKGLVGDGIVAGICAMLGFLPQMFVLFVLLALIEGCGYMARVAFVLDRIFRRFGLSGKSFIPMLIGTGCGVPGIMASRTIENPADRRMTVMTTTFIPCSAKTAIIGLVSSAVFGGVWWVAPSAYFLGIATILCSGIILKKTRPFMTDVTPFVMELPAYHVPTAGYMARSVWERLWAFIKKAFTILLVATILIWLLSSFGVENGAFGMVEDQGDSILAAIGRPISVLFIPLGFGFNGDGSANWQAAASVVAGFMAKEQIVGTIGVLYGSGDVSWYSAFMDSFGLANGYAFLAFNLLCMPCFAAVGSIASEMKSAKWTLAAIGYQFLIAWFVGFWIFQFAGLATGEATFGIWTIIAIITFAIFIFLLVRPMPKNSASAPAHAKAVAAE